MRPTATGAIAIPPGQEALLSGLLGGDPADCALTGADVKDARIDARYDCAGAPVSVTLTHPRLAEGARLAGPFALIPGAEAPPALVDTLAGRAEALEGFAWVELTPPDAAETEAAPGVEPAWTLPSVGLLLVLALGWVALAVTRRRRGPAPATTGPADGTWLPGAVLSAGVLVLSLATSRFWSDDFDALRLAAHGLARPEPSMRLFGVQLPFMAAHAAGDALWVFWPLLVGAGVGLALSARWLARQRDPDAAAFTTSLVLLAPGLGVLLRWPSGFHFVAALALALAAVAALETARQGRGPWWIGLGAALMATGMLVKFPVMAVAPAIAFPWIAGRPERSRTAGLFEAALLAGVGALVWLHFPLRDPAYTELGKLGTGALGANLAQLAAALTPFGLQLVLALALAALLPGPEGAFGGARRLRERLRPALPALLAGALATVPFLLNRDYFADYYAAVPALFLLLAAGPAIHAAVRPRPWASLPLALILFPWPLLFAPVPT